MEKIGKKRRVTRGKIGKKSRVCLEKKKCMKKLKRKKRRNIIKNQLKDKCFFEGRKNIGVGYLSLLHRLRFIIKIKLKDYFLFKF